jgi:[NiFe] hydrogenase diaphorase moiety large subunit
MRMEDPSSAAIRSICTSVDRDPGRLLDVLRAVQAQCGCVDNQAVATIADCLEIPEGRVRSLVGFYAFLSERPLGEVVIRLADDVPDWMAGRDRVEAAFVEELGIRPGATTPDGRIGLAHTSCIGMSDQGPAALVGDVVVTELSTDRAREVVAGLRSHGQPARLVRKLGDGNNAHPLVRAMVRNNIRQAGPLVLTEPRRGEAMRHALAMSPAEVIRAVKTARLRGRGGAGFPTGMKWEYARQAPGAAKFVICNADEGEPGTFGDRVLLTELPDRVFAGMTIAAYAVGARRGILYLRAEYAYLAPFLEHILEARRRDGLLGHSILGREGFDFDLRIQLGAGAYVCGEETALIESCEGLPGTPRNRPPFPAQRGYLGHPTVVNNVETLACVTRILEAGPAMFCAQGNPSSSGTIVLSVSGDCELPGVYELPFGTSVREVLERAHGREVAAVQVGGPSGRMVPARDFDRRLGYEDLPTGGAFVALGADRDPVEVAARFTAFFAEESCGHCTPCRVGTGMLRDGLERLRAGRAGAADLDMLNQLAATMRATSRCGLGQTAARPFLTSLEAFPDAYATLLRSDPDGLRAGFDLERAVATATGIRDGGTHVR